MIARTVTDSPKILVVDDDCAIHELASEALRGSYVMKAVASGEEALLAIKSDKPDLLLVDIAMPGIHGDELCRRLKIDNATSSLPVIFVSVVMIGCESSNCKSVIS